MCGWLQIWVAGRKRTQIWPRGTILSTNSFRPIGVPPCQQLDQSNWGMGGYEAAVAAVAGDFRPAIVERSGAVGDDMHGLLRMFAGDGEREHGADDDWYFSAPSRVSYFMQHVVFATVMADASMLDSVIGLDVGGDRQGGVGAAQGPGG